ncbi:MAG: nucleoside deaminase [Candidatus Dojkabacteria bacterium]
MVSNRRIEEIMKIVYQEVEDGIAEGNPPWAAVITDRDGTILVKAHNQTNTSHDPTAHAEILALRKAGQLLRSKKLNTCLIFSNAESCSMCLSAIIKAKITEVYYGIPAESDSNPNINAEFIKSRCLTELHLHAGIMQDIFMEQLRRARKQEECKGCN